VSKEPDASLPGEDPLDQILAEYLQAADTASPPDQQAFLGRYPEHAADLREFFASQERFEQAAQPFRFDGAATQGPALAGASTPDESSGPLASPGQRVRYFGEYELLEEIARGGMGVVFKAKQVRLNRVVALKMILAGQFASAEDVKRFQVEAQNAAQLDHPNIVPVYEVGRHKGQHYFTMKLVEGTSLTGRAGHFSKDHKSAAALMATIAKAVDYAHQRGILHRDIKPGNVLLDSTGQPQVTDFGLARRLEENAEAAKLTLTGAIVGSPSYMAPEQARGEKGLTVAADVYALGAVLYELLTGKPPFSGANTFMVLEQVRLNAPARPGSINGAISRDLEVVCLKCLDKQPQRRYRSARALAEDLERWSRGEPITARRVGTPERLWRWCRRKPALATAAGLALGATLAALVILTVAVVLIGRARDRQEALAKKEGVARLEQEAQRQRADSNARAAAISEKKAEERLANGLVAAGDSLLTSGRAVDARQSYGEAWGIDRQQGLAEFPVIAGLVQSYASSPPPLLSPMKRDGQVTVPFLHEQRVEGAAISPDGRRALSASGEVLRLWDAATGQLIRSYSGHTSLVLAVAFSADGLHALSGGDDRSVRYFSGQADAVRSVDVSRDGRLALLVSAGKNPSLRVWDVATRRQLRSCTLSSLSAIGAPLAYSSSCTATLSQDGRSVLVGCGDGSIRLWDSLTGQARFAISGHSSAVNAVAFSADGTLAASGAADGALRVWDLPAGKARPTIEGHRRGIESIAFSPDGTLLISASDDYTLALWDVAKRASKGIMKGHTDRVLGVAFSPDGRTAISASVDQTLRLWDVSTCQTLRTFKGHWHYATGVALAPDGRTAASSSLDGTVRLWDVATARQLAILTGHVGGVNCVAFSGDGRALFSGGADQTVRQWDFDRPRSYEKWDATLAQAHETLGRRLDDPTSLAVFGEWYAFRGIDAWAVELLEKARTGRAPVSHLTLARCYWRLGLALEAEREFRAAADGPVTSDTYFGQCINGLVPISGPSIAGPAPSLDALAMLQVRRGEFKEAVAAYARSIESDPTNHMTWILRAGLLASVGYRDAYVAHCRAMLERFGNTDDPLIAERIAKACLLLPEAGVDPRRALALVERSVSQDNQHYRAWAQFAKGLALYRCGDASARAWLLRSKSPFDASRSQVADLLLAEIDVHRAHTPEAEGALRRALGTINFNSSLIMDNASGPGFINLMNCQTLGREAQELLKTHLPAAEPLGPSNRAATTAPVTPVHN
jgi:WD40 repeat protein